MVSATVRVVWKVLIDATAPTFRISAKNRARSGAQRRRAMLRPVTTAQPSSDVVMAEVITTAQPAPAIPIAGTGPQPKISSGESGISSTTPSTTASDGSIMLPVPRSTLAKALYSQTSTAPAKTTSEYCSAASSAAPSPPSAR